MLVWKKLQFSQIALKARSSQRFIELAANEGLLLTWVPNTELTYLLADAETPEAPEPVRVSATPFHPDQYDPVNAIKFLMLATAMLAEMEYDGRPHPRRDCGLV